MFLSWRSTTRSMSLENGLYRALLELLPLSKAFNCMALGRIERPLSQKKKSTGTHRLSIPASDPLSPLREGVAAERNPLVRRTLRPSEALLRLGKPFALVGLLNLSNAAKNRGKGPYLRATYYSGLEDLGVKEAFWNARPP